jgi:hypothetical protein
LEDAIQHGRYGLLYTTIPEQLRNIVLKIQLRTRCCSPAVPQRYAELFVE